MNLLIAIFTIAVFIVILNFSIERYDSLNGLFLILLGLLLIGLKLLISGETKFSIIESFWISGLIITIITVFACSLILLIKNLRKGLKYNFKYLIFLLVLYIFFGYLQQLFFQFIFAESVYYLTKNFIFAVFVSAVFYFSVHLRSRNIEFLVGTFLLGILWSASYLMFGNLFWFGLSHGILGTMYYLNLWDVDVLRKKLKLVDKYL